MRMALGILLTIAAAHPGCALSAPAPRHETPRPATGLDFSGVDQFWKIVDILSTDTEPTDAQWRDLLGTPGYRLVAMNFGDAIRDAVNMTFRPSRHAEFVTRAAADDDRASP